MKSKPKQGFPILSGAAGFNLCRRKFYWEFSRSAPRTRRYPIVVGENVVGVDKQSVIKNGKIEVLAELDRRVDTYLRYHDGYARLLFDERRGYPQRRRGIMSSGNM